MARIELAPEVGEDLDRIIDHLTRHEGADIPARIREIIQAIDVLQHSPLIGRPVAAGKREWVIGRRSHGYVALYRHIAEIDTVFVLAVKGQREAGYA
ncbi:MAG: type II toxin-antitoxin system RelE/ParE family toxin [Pseudomonadota bacterium]|nr:type II toxin-antitoxin system RelE/ParE family toxin [Pseudomonadota bacterium]